MDFADVAKLLWRRWYLTAPLLLLTVVAMVWMALVVKPDYKAVGNVTLIPPTVVRQVEVGKTQEVNPWEPSALAEATLIRLQSKALADSMAAQGYKGEWTVYTLDTDAPIISIEVVSPTEEQASVALAALVQVVNQEVETKQQPYKLAAGEKISTLPLESSDSVERVNTKLNRALVVVFGVGVILTIGVAVSVDAVLRRRARRAVETLPPRNQVPSTPPRPTPGPLASPIDTANTTRFMTGEAAQKQPAMANGPAKGLGNGAGIPSQAGPQRTPPTPPKKTGGAVYGQRRTDDSAPSGTPTTYGGITPNFSSGGDKDKPAEQPKPKPVPEDATIVLPLSNTSWGTKSTSKATEAKKP